MAGLLPSAIRAGELTNRVTLQVKVKTTNDLGEEVEAWQEWKTVWASVVQMSATEQVIGSQTTVIARYLVTIRYLPGVTEQMRMLVEGGVCGIVNVNDVGKQHERMELTCVEDKTSQGVG